MSNRQQMPYRNRVSVGMSKGDERYVVVAYADRIHEVGRLLAGWASDPELSFTWKECYMLWKRVCEEAKR